MSQPVKLTESLVLDARLAGEVMERSIAGQVEFWARLGRSLEPLLQGEQVLALCRKASAKSLSSCLEEIDTSKGRKKVKEFLESQPFPHYEPHPEKIGFLVRTDADGSKTVGRFIKRVFKPIKIASRVGCK